MNPFDLLKPGQLWRTTWYTDPVKIISVSPREVVIKAQDGRVDTVCLPFLGPVAEPEPTIPIWYGDPKDIPAWYGDSRDVPPNKPQPDADGWIPWAGGLRPVPVDTPLQAEFSNRFVSNVRAANSFHWGKSDDPSALSIISYRIVRPTARPWDRPADVPTPVCWLKWDGLHGCRLVTAVEPDGVRVDGSYWSWECLHRVSNSQYSTDGTTWKPCTAIEEGGK